MDDAGQPLSAGMAAQSRIQNEPMMTYRVVQLRATME